MKRMMKLNIFLFAGLFSAHLFSADPKFYIENKTNKTIYIDYGSRMNDNVPVMLSGHPFEELVSEASAKSDSEVKWLLISPLKNPVSGSTKLISVKLNKNKAYIDLISSNKFCLKQDPKQPDAYVCLSIVPQEKDSKKSSILSAKNSAGYSLSGNITNKDIVVESLVFFTGSKPKEVKLGWWTELNLSSEKDPKKIGDAEIIVGITGGKFVNETKPLDAIKILNDALNNRFVHFHEDKEIMQKVWDAGTNLKLYKFKDLKTKTPEITAKLQELDKTISDIRKVSAK